MFGLARLSIVIRVTFVVDLTQNNFGKHMLDLVGIAQRYLTIPFEKKFLASTYLQIKLVSLFLDCVVEKDTFPHWLSPSGNVNLVLCYSYYE